MPAPIDFYFDFSSPYAYLAATRIDGIAHRFGRTVAWKPVLLGAVFKLTGMQPGAAIPLRGPYMNRDAPRFARLWNVPFRLPSRFPIGAVAASRAAWWLNQTDPATAGRLCRALLEAYFVEDRDISDPEQVIGIATGLGIDGDALRAALADEAVKAGLKAQVDTAIANGVFGSPFVVVDGEPFWGADRLWQVELWLEGKGRSSTATAG